MDNNSRRFGGDRRTFSYTEHSPERRSGKNRRFGVDSRYKTKIGGGQKEGSLKNKN